MATLLNAFVHTLRFEAEDIISVELRPVPGTGFPAFTAGAHIDLHLPNGMVRSYSLSNPVTDSNRYVVGVLRDRASRGGSRCVHEQLRIGMRLSVTAPHNNFPLHEDAGHSARAGAAFVEELQALGMPLTLHFDAEQGGPPDLKALLSRRPSEASTHYYACGPAVMLDAFEQTCAALGHENAHIERFTAVEVAAASDAKATYTVELRRTGRSITVAPAKSLLDTLLDAGVDVPHSCCEGICGSCETRVLDGEPDHRDSVLSAKERAANKVMMVCVSGCKSSNLALDL